MNRIIENLHIKFDCLINTRDNQSFFLRLADYVGYITREEETYQIIKKIEKAIEEEKEEGDSIYENKKERFWRTYQEILLIYSIVNEKEKRKKLKELQKETLLKERWKFQDMIEEWEKIKMPMNKKTCAIFQNPEILKIKKYKDYLIEVHNYLYSNLPKAEIEKNKKSPILENIFKEKKWKDWNDIEIKFIDQFDVNVYIDKKFERKLNNIDLGFYKSKTKDKNPDMQWIFLYLLSSIQILDEKTATCDEMARRIGEYSKKNIDINNCEQIKSKLSKRLKEIFKINEDPFFCYKEYKYYKTKFKLTPTSNLRGSGEIYITKRNDFKEDYDYNKSEDYYCETEE